MLTFCMLSVLLGAYMSPMYHAQTHISGLHCFVFGQATQGYMKLKATHKLKSHDRMQEWMDEPVSE